MRKMSKWEIDLLKKNGATFFNTKKTALSNTILVRGKLVKIAVYEGFFAELKEPENKQKLKDINEALSSAIGGSISQLREQLVAASTAKGMNQFTNKKIIRSIISPLLGRIPANQLSGSSYLPIIEAIMDERINEQMQYHLTITSGEDAASQEERNKLLQIAKPFYDIIKKATPIIEKAKSTPTWFYPNQDIPVAPAPAAPAAAVTPGAPTTATPAPGAAPGALPPVAAAAKKVMKKTAKTE
jgi:hypothetical protein